MQPNAEPAPRIPDFELLRLIGRGSYGDVWLARGITGVYRAVKIVWRDRFPDPRPYEREFEGITRFAAVSIREPSQLVLLHAGRSDAADFFYYVMELADDAEKGRDILPEHYVPLTLKELRARRGRLAPGEVVAIGVALARALASLHAAHLVHRDIKPSNVVLVGGVPKLADVGLVAAAEAGLTFVGTEGFVPPEGPGAVAADVFGLGKVLYELATGFDRRDFPRLPGDLAAWPDRKEVLELNEVLLRACEPHPAQRYPDAAALLDDLLLLQAGRSVRRLRAAERRLTRALRVAALLALVAAVAGAGAWVQHERAKKAEAERDDLARKSVYSAGLARAQRALETDNLGLARRRLKELVPATDGPDLRGFEWYALWREAQGDPAEVLRESGPAVQRVCFSPDARLVASLGADMVVTLWDAAAHRAVRRIPRVYHLAGFSADGAWLVGADTDAALQRWSVATGAPDERPAPGPNRAVALVGSGGWAACFTIGRGGSPHAVRTWNFARHAETARLTLSPDLTRTRWDFYRAAIAADGTRCAVALITGRSPEARWKLQLYDFAGQRLLYEEPTPHRLSALAFAADGRRLAVALGDMAEVAVFDLGQNQWTWQKKFGANQTNALTFSPDGTRLALGGRDSIVRIVDAANGAVLDRLRGQEAGIEDLCWSPDGNRLLSGGSAGDVRWWQPAQRTAETTITGLWQSTSGGPWICLSADGSRIALADLSHGVPVFSTETTEELTRLAGAFVPLAFAPGAEELWTLDRAGGVQRWDLRAPRRLDQAALAVATVPSTPAVSDDRHLAVYGDAVGRLHWWDMQAGRLVADTKAHRGAVWWCAISADDRQVLSSGEDRTVRIWDRDSRRELALWKSPYDVNYAATSPDGRMVAAAMGNGTVEIRLLPSLQLHRVLRTANAILDMVAFSPDGRRLVCGGTEGGVGVYATDDWRELVELTTARVAEPEAGGGVNIDVVAFNKGGSVLAAHLRDGRVRLWRR